MSQFQVGEVVRLKSGGPEMVVTGALGPGVAIDVRYATGHVCCKWITASGEAQFDTYPAEALVKVRP